MEQSGPNSTNPAPRRRPTLKSLSSLAITIVGAIAFAAWLFVNLGDFTAERGWRAAFQVAATSLAFGAMLHLIVEAVIRTIQGMQNDFDALTGARQRRGGPD